MKKILPLIFAVMLLFCGCSKGVKLEGGRWYIDDRNNTVRTVVTFEEKTGKLHVNYILIDEGRAERTGVDGLQYVFDVYYYKDFGKNIPEKYSADVSDENAFAVYYTKEDYEADENAMIIPYCFEEDKLVSNGNVCIAVTEEMGKEIDETVAGNKAAIGE